MENHQMFIGGKWVDSVSGATFDDLNPYTGALYARVAKGNVEDTRRVMAAAYAARREWASTPPLVRSQVLYKAAQMLEADRQGFADVLIQEGGSAFGKAMFEISQTVDLLETAAADSKRILGETFHNDPGKLSMTIRRPRGTVVAISPWNFPLILSMYKVAYSIATGNTVVLKPASETPVIGLKIGELFEKAGLPAGVLNVITGPGSILGDALIDDDRCSFVTITGETVTGRHVAQRAAAKLKEYTLELGGKNPLIILADADMEYAVKSAAFSAFLHQGEICMSVDRVIVEKPIAEEFSKRLADLASHLPVGDPSLPTTFIGPVISDNQVQKIHAHVQDAVAKGAKLLTGGTHEGRLYKPTVLSAITREMQIYYEETFGPVTSVIPVNDEKQALEVANDTTYGLSAGVITKDLEKAIFLAEGLEAGMVHVNDGSIDADACTPFGGCKSSGQGREGGQYSIEELTELKWVTIQKKGRMLPF
ncbi:MAG TPA: aldehyde dehydrogenase family protein [Syntrophorhabdaceae bacterium]|nr:aldehyde dehydrogenase family protein [Syntrophorhabdaceae bacterium]